MAVFNLIMGREGRSRQQDGLDMLRRTVDWPEVPRGGDGVELGLDRDPVQVNQLVFSDDGVPEVDLGMHEFDDAEVAWLVENGWVYEHILPDE